MGSASPAALAVNNAAAAKAVAAKRNSKNKVPKAAPQQSPKAPTGVGPLREPSAEFVYESRRQGRIVELNLQAKEQQEERAAMVRDGVPLKAKHRQTTADEFLALNSQEQELAAARPPVPPIPASVTAGQGSGTFSREDSSWQQPAERGAAVAGALGAKSKAPPPGAPEPDALMSGPQGQVLLWRRFPWSADPRWLRRRRPSQKG